MKENILEIIAYAVPTNKTQAIIGSLGGIAFSLIGGLDRLLWILIILILADYMSGLLKGAANNDLSSSTGYKGIIKKASMFLVIILAFQMDNVCTYMGIDNPVFRNMTVFYFIVNEGISLLENYSALCGEPPAFLMKILKIWKESTNEGKTPQ